MNAPASVDLLLAGDIILTRSKGLVGGLIRFGERVRYQGWLRAMWWLLRRLVRLAPADTGVEPWWVNHAAVSIGCGRIIEALAQGLTENPASKYSGDPVIVVPLAQLCPDVTDADRAAVARFARTQLARHDRYGWLSIASIILQLITPIHLDISWDGALICSAFAAQALEHAGVTLSTRSSLTTMPADLRAMASTVARPEWTSQ